MIHTKEQITPKYKDQLMVMKWLIFLRIVSPLLNMLQKSILYVIGYCAVVLQGTG